MAGERRISPDSQPLHDCKGTVYACTTYRVKQQTQNLPQGSQAGLIHTDVYPEPSWPQCPTQSRFDGSTVSSACPQDTGDKHRKDCSQVLQPPIPRLWASSRSCLTKGSAFGIVMEQSTPESCPTFLGPSFPICHVDRPHSLTAMARSECIPKSLSVFIDEEQLHFCLC